MLPEINGKASGFSWYLDRTSNPDTLPLPLFLLWRKMVKDEGKTLREKVAFEQQEYA